MKHSELCQESHGDTLRLSWDNRRMEIKRPVFVGLAGFWLIWAPLTSYAAWRLFQEGPAVWLCIWLVFGCLGTFLIPYVLLRRFWAEWIEISPETFSFGFTGFLAPKPKRLLPKQIREITIGYHGEPPEAETMLTLNLYNQGRWWAHRHMLAYWLTDDLKEEIFETLRQFVLANHMPVKMTRVSPALSIPGAKAAADSNVPTSKG